MNRISKAITCCLLATVSITASAVATQVVHRTPKQLGEQAQLVVRGRVVDVRSQWNDKRTKIFTTTRVAVDESYKGSGAGTVDLVQMGGTVDNVKVTVHGALAWNVGEEVLLFLERAGGGVYHVSGFSQGKFKITRNEATGEAFVNRPELLGTELVESSSLEPSAASSRVDEVPLDRFINQALGGR